VQIAAIEVLAEQKGSRVFSALLRKLEHPDMEIRRCAILALGKTGNPAAFESLLYLLDSPDWSERNTTVEALGLLGDPRAEHHLREIRVGDPDELLRKTADRALQSLMRK